MSLQVWLPLNGDLIQQGLSDIQVTNNGATIDNNGKIGKCYSFDGTNDYITIPISSIKENTEDISFAFWVNFLSFNTAYQSVFSATGSSPSWNQEIFCFQRNSTNSTFTFEIADGNSSTAAYLLTNDLSINTWYHFVCTYTSGKISIYQNGEFVRSYSTTIVPNFSAIQNFQLGRSHTTYYSNMKLNDFRLYNHCLSQKEIKEISKGLVLHYKLDGKEETSSNLITTDDGLSNTAYNGATGKYGYNTDSNIAKVVGDFNGKHCTKVYMITAGQNAKPYVYINNLFVSNGTSQPAYKALSFDYYGTIGTYINHYKLGSGTGTVVWKNTTTGQSGNFTNSGNILVTPNQWNHIEIILHGTTNENAEFGYFPLGDTHVSSTDNYWLFANIQVETKDHVTPYMGPGGSRNYITEFDCSGYNNNGTIIGTLTGNSNTSKYNGSTYLYSSDPTTNSSTGLSYIEANFGLTAPVQMSVCWWAKPESGYGGSTAHAAWCTSLTSVPTDYNSTAFHHRDGAFDICLNSASTTSIRLNIDYTKNEWHYYCVIYDGKIAKLYKDGTFSNQVTVSNTDAPLKTFSKLFIGYSRAGGVWRKTLGSYSDFRIYATALSAEEVAELYHTAASIDNKGNVYAYELKEV